VIAAHIAQTLGARETANKLPGQKVVAVPAEGLPGGRAGAGPLRLGAAGRAPGGVPVHVRAPEPARAAPLGPALGVVLPRLAAAVREGNSVNGDSLGQQTIHRAVWATLS
jgi:hypothetical protein